MNERKLSDFEVIRNPEYVAIGAKYVKMLRDIESSKGIGVKREVILESALEAIKGIEQSLNEFVIKNSQVYKERLKAIRFEKKPQNYGSPEELILQRQDVELKFKTMSANDIKDYASDIEEFHPDLFELQQLQLASERIEDVNTKQFVTLKINQYKEETNVTQPYKNSPEYMTNERLLNELEIVGNSLYILRDAFPNDLSLDPFNTNPIDAMDKKVKMVFDLNKDVEDSLKGYN
jgi:hypothetical protein